VHEEEDVDEQDTGDANDHDDAEEEETHKDDRSTHATVVADLGETTKPQRERGALEKSNQTNQAKTKAKAEATTETRRRREERRIPACHRHIRDQKKCDNRRRPRSPRNPATGGTSQNVPLPLACRKHIEHLHAKQSR